jgi:hypothetical protein
MKVEVVRQVFTKVQRNFPGNLFSGIDGFQLALIWDVNGYKLGADFDWNN